MIVAQERALLKAHDQFEALEAFVEQAAVNGPAVAGGLGLVAACDLVLAAPGNHGRDRRAVSRVSHRGRAGRVPADDRRDCRRRTRRANGAGSRAGEVRPALAAGGAARRRMRAVRTVFVAAHQANAQRNDRRATFDNALGRRGGERDCPHHRSGCRRAEGLPRETPTQVVNSATSVTVSRGTCPARYLVRCGARSR